MKGQPKTAPPMYRVSVTRGGVTRTTDLDATSANYTVHAAVQSNLVVSCRRLREGEARIDGILVEPETAGQR